MEGRWVASTLKRESKMKLELKKYWMRGTEKPKTRGTTKGRLAELCPVRMLRMLGELLREG